MEELTCQVKDLNQSWSSRFSFISAIFLSCSSGDGGSWVFRVDYDQPITVNSFEGWQVRIETMLLTNSFQVCTAASVELCNHLVGWKDISASSSDSQSVYFDLTAECSTSGCSGLAYLWRETPCLVHLSCPIYSAATPNLPATPWIWSLWKNNVVKKNKNKEMTLILIHSWAFS